MKSKTNSWIFTSAVLLGACALTWEGLADQETLGGYTWSYEIAGDGVVVTGASPKPTGAVTIPSRLGDRLVTGIGSFALYGCSNLTSLTIPDSVTSIGYYAFRDCIGLTSVTIPDGVTSIDDYAFYGCIGLTSVVIPDSVMSIGYYAFYGCIGLTSVTIGNGLRSIGYDAFSGCSGLVSFFVADDNFSYKAVSGLLLTKDGKTLVAGVNGDVTIPDGVTKIADDAFRGCVGLRSVTIPDSVASIGDVAFMDCGSLTSVTIPNGVTNIGIFAFADCSGLMAFSVADDNPSYMSVSGLLLTKDGKTLVAGVNGNVTIPDSVTSIEDCAFRGCSNLTNVTIPDSVKSIGYHAFGGCSSLTRMTMPGSVTNIGARAFRGCKNVDLLVFDGDAPNCGASPFLDGPTNAYVKAGTSGWGDVPGTWNGLQIDYIRNDGGPYKETVNGEEWTFYVVNGCAELRNGCIRSDITGDLQVPSILGGCRVTTLADFAMYRIGVQSIAIPSCVTSIGIGTFSGCSGLVSFAVANENPSYKAVAGLLLTKDGETLVAGVNGDVTIPNGVTGIGSNAFGGCSCLTSVIIPDSVAHVEDAAFAHCIGLTSVMIPDGVTNIIDSAFSGCSRLMSFVVADENPSYKASSGLLLTKDGKTLVAGVNGDVTIPDGVTSIGLLAFFDYGGLTSVTIPDSVTSMTSASFYHCSGLKSVTIPQRVCTAGLFRTFGGAYQSITNVVIANGVTSIGSSAFGGCSSLTSVTIPDSVTNIDEYAFHNCSALTSIIIPEGVIEIGNHAFDGCTALANITLPKSLKRIGVSAFADCGSLTSISLPAGFEAVGDAAFSGCTNLSEVIVRCAAPEGVGASDLFDYVECVRCCRKHYAGYSAFFTEDKIVAYLDALPPVITPADGTVFADSATVNITSAEDGAVVHFTTNGTLPTADSPVFRRFRAYHRMTIRAVAIADDLEPSAIVESTIAPGKCAIPTFSVPDGTVFSNANYQVAISWDTENGELHYTLDGSEPTIGSTTYIGPLMFSDDITIKAKVFGFDYFDSDVATLTLDRVIPDVPMPTLADGVVTEFTGGAQMVSLICDCPEAIIRYTLDGSSPDESSMVYNKPFRICEGVTLKAYATYSDWRDSTMLVVVFKKQMHLGDYVEAPDHYFTVKNDNAWRVDQMIGACNGNSIKSGHVAVDSISDISTVVSGSGKVIFSWKTDTIEDTDLHDWNHVEFLVDGVELCRLDGATLDWKRVELPISGLGEHELTWRFVRYYDDSAEVQDCAWFDAFIWVPDNDNTVAVKTPEAEVPNKWLYDNGLLGDRMPLNAVNMPTGKMDALGNAMYVWQDYVAGTDPTNLTSRFAAKIEMLDGVPIVTWVPDLNENGSKSERLYKVYGKVNLTDAAWDYPTNSLHRFFKVTVEMP